jgi:hypothetical protein
MNLDDEIERRLNALNKQFDVLPQSAYEQARIFLNWFKVTRFYFSEEILDYNFMIIRNIFYKPQVEIVNSNRDGLVKIISDEDLNKESLTKKLNLYKSFKGKINLHSYTFLKHRISDAVLRTDSLMSDYERLFAHVRNTQKEFPCMKELTDWAMEYLERDANIIAESKEVIIGLLQEISDKKFTYLN